MKNLMLIVILMGIFPSLMSQNLSYNDLRTIVEYKDFQIDTFLVKRQYIASPKEQEGDTYYFRWNYKLDSVGGIKYNYVSVVDIYQKNNKNRMLRYGTVDPMEMVDIVEGLKEDGYVYKDKYDYGGQIHVSYQKGKEKVIMKYISVQTKTDIDTVFEFEFGS